MTLTKEQEAIIASDTDLIVNAVAGSGKTSTIIEYAKARPSESKILYLAFNKSVRVDAARKFLEKGLNNVTVETAHSLAFRHVVRGGNFKLSQAGYRPHEVVELFSISNEEEKHGAVIVGKHVIQFLSYFCNSDAERVKDLNYLDTIKDPKAIGFVTKHYDQIELLTRLLLKEMDSGKIAITHDFYLKKFQLSRPVLDFDYILFDEGQDASPAMLDVFVRQKAIKVIVGDSNQQIYSWRFAVNSLEKVAFKKLNLTTSFRFGPEIAALAKASLRPKKLLGSEAEVQIIGKGTSDQVRTKAVLARTNLGLLLKAIEYVTEKKEVERIYFEGNIGSYAYAEDGTSLYDVLNLYQKKYARIKDKLLQGMRSIEELEEYIEKTEEHQLGMMLEVVKEYGSAIPKVLKELKDKHIGEDERHKAQLIFSTVHRSKGMEYDAVQIVDDFMTNEQMEKLLTSKKQEDIDFGRLGEEVNLIYVAITRAANKVFLPSSILPEGIKASEKIRVLKTKSTSLVPQSMPAASGGRKHSKGQSEDVKKRIKAKHKKAYQPWTNTLDKELEELYNDGVTIKDLANHFNRTTGAIRARMKHLELNDQIKYF
tara:strand:+ start:14331 stop:16115 length:1785 start_codon:yes stop_codon:yes gene_type:complete